MFNRKYIFQMVDVSMFFFSIVMLVFRGLGFLKKWHLRFSQVPMLNLTDCVVSFCIVLLVTTSTLYLNVIEAGLVQKKIVESSDFHDSPHLGHDEKD